MVEFVHYVYDNHWGNETKVCSKLTLNFEHISVHRDQISTGQGCGKISQVAAWDEKSQNGSFGMRDVKKLFFGSIVCFAGSILVT